MQTRSIMAVLLAVAISAAANVHPASASARSAGVDAEKERPLTPEEEEEARSLVMRFNERLRETTDLGPIIDELFVHDFSERLNRQPTGFLLWCFLSKNVIAEAGRDKLRRSYVAWMNFYELVFRLYQAIAALKKQSGDGEVEDRLKIGDALSPEIIRVLLGDPVMAKLYREGLDDESTQEDNNGQPATSGDSSQAEDTASQTKNNDATEKSEDTIINNLSQLEAVSSTLEKAVALMRSRLASLAAVAPNWPGDEATKTQRDSLELYLASSEQDLDGSHEDARVIKVAAMPFSLRLIRVDGQLKILSADIYVD